MKMAKDINYDYDKDLDILHVYSSEIKQGIKGNISFGYSTLDIGYNGKIVGMEIEEASKLFKVSSEVLSKLDNVSLEIRKMGNLLFIGVFLKKGFVKTNFQINFPVKKTPLMISN
tara:strand:+ start:1112 stop:1456 length:345 start_codon:yes stop_codon:yes gene_type:complete